MDPAVIQTRCTPNSAENHSGFFLSWVFLLNEANAVSNLAF